MSFAAGAWLTSGLLLVFAIAGRRIAVQEARHRALGLPAHKPLRPTSAGRGEVE